MFIHNLKYSLKTLFKNRMLIFWTYAFPIILGIFFYMAFSDIESSEKLDIIDIAVVDNTYFQDNHVAKETFRILSDKDSKEQLFHTRYVSENEAKKLLNDEKITGYVLTGKSDIKVVVAASGINETVLKSVVDDILQNTKIVEKAIENGTKKAMIVNAGDIPYEKIYKDAVCLITDSQEVKIKNISSDNLSHTMIEYYTLIAMACLYSGILGMVAMNQNMPNMTHIGKRVGVSPTSKIKLVLSSVLAGYIVQLIGLAVLFVFTIFVLGVDYGDKIPYIVLLAMAGCLSGLSIGIAVGTLLKANENTKTGIIISITMAGCFFSGMMGITMKYVVDTNIPLLNKINPASMITDGFYSLYYYETMDRYFFDLVSLLIFAGILICLSFTGLRRQTYDSI